MFRPFKIILQRQGLPSQLKTLAGISPRFLSTEPSIRLVESLKAALPSHVEISTNSYDLISHGKGESYHPTAPPSAVVSPSKIDDVVAIVRHCALHKIPIIPFGVGTSVEGHVAALHGGISVDTRKFDFIEFDNNEESLPDAMVCVGAGVTRRKLNEALRHTGMQFVVDPGADATIGGMVGVYSSDCCSLSSIHYSTG
jgi:D-lactate dehydrogenase (cytochrome)